jgi:hypothetical protein
MSTIISVYCLTLLIEYVKVHKSDGFFQIRISPEPGFIQDPEFNVMIDKVFHFLQKQYFSIERIARVLKFVKFTIKTSPDDTIIVKI